MSGRSVNYYRVLGVSYDAEQVVIKAAYKALIKVYHPDTGNGDNERAALINEAYEVLGSPEKRALYDESRTAEEEINSNFETNNTTVDEILTEEWDIACRYNESLDYYCKSLKRISGELAISYKLLLLSSQNFDQAKNIYKTIREKYLSRYFGKDMHIQDFAEQLIYLREKKALLTINKTVKVLGNSLKYWALRREICKEYPHILEDLKKLNLFERSQEGELTFYELKDYVRLIGGSLKEKGLFMTKYILRAVDLCCTYFTQQYIGSHIIENASDTILA